MELVANMQDARGVRVHVSITSKHVRQNHMCHACRGHFEV